MKRPRGKLELVKCPLCDFSCKRLTTFEKHVEEEHNLDLCALWNDINDGPKVCECGCSGVTKFYGWKKGYAKFINGHNAHKSCMGENAEAIIEKRRQTLKKNIENGTVTPWSKGLTKKTDDRIAARTEASTRAIRLSFENGREQWSKGKTKESDDRVMIRALRLKKKYESGELTPWSKGKTENDDPRLKKKNELLRERYKTGELEPWSKGLTKETDNRLKRKCDYDEFTNTDIIKHLGSNKQLRLERVDGYKNKNRPSLIVRCNACEWSSKVALTFAENDQCPKCTRGGMSLQLSIANWIKSLGFDVMLNVKGVIGQQTVDVYVPTKGFGIECNSLYWGNELSGKGSNYCEMKSDLSDTFGIKLFHVFEDEWINDQDVIKSIIRSKLGMSTKKYDARKCEVKKLTSKERKSFFVKNHIEGDVASLVSWGLFYGEELVCALSLRRPFHKVHNSSIEVARYCTLIDANVRGGLGKLFSCAKKFALNEGYENIITYVDRRFGDGHGYKAIGFELERITTPRFWWTDYTRRYNRFKFRADRSRGMSEFQVSEEAGVVRIWGCSNLVFKMNV